MKRKFSLLALCLAALMCCSLFLFAACETDDPSGTTNTITATLSETEVTVGETVTLTYSATEGTVTVTVSKDGGAAETVTGTTFTPNAAGTYVFTFAAEGATSVTRTLTVTEAQQPAAPVITAAADKTEITAGESVTLTWSATESAAVTVTYTKDGAAADTLKPVSGQPLTIAEAGTYVFTFAAEGAESKTVTVKVNEAVTPVITLEVFDEPVENNGSDTACVGTEITYAVSVTENAVATASVTINNGAAQPITELTGSYTFSAAGTYVFTIEADGAADFVYTVKADAHTYGAWRLDTTPSATQKGELVRTCPNCFTQTPGHTETEELPEVTAENIGSDKAYTQTSLTPATCAEEGSATYSVNGYENISFTLTLSVDSTAHKYTAVSVPYNGDTMSVSWEQTVSVTCDNGCDTPLVLTTETLNKMDLQPDTENDYTPPTHTQAGSGNYFGTAEQDGYTVTVTVVGVPIPAEGTHTYGNVTMTAEDYAAALAKDGGNYTLTCTYSGCSVTFTFELFATSDEGWTESDVQNASCTAAGSKTLSRTVSGQDSSGQDVSIILTVTGVEIPKIDHALVKVEGKAATCTESGWNAYWQCSVCDEIFTADDQKSGTGKTEVTADLEGIYLGPKGHNMSATWSSDGNGHWHECTNEGCTYREDSASHTWEYTQATNNHYKKCSVCEYEATENHSGTYVYDSETGKIDLVCTLCDGSYEYDIKSVAVETGTNAYVYDNGDETYTFGGFTFYVGPQGYTGATGVSKPDKIAIPADDMVVSSVSESVNGAWWLGNVEFAFAPYGSAVAGSIDCMVYTQRPDSLPGEGQSFTAYDPDAVQVGTFTGEFFYRIELQNVTTALAEPWDSWLLQMSAGNGAFAVLRPDAWVVDAWGQATDLPNGGATADSVDAIEFFTSDSSGNGYLQTGNLAVAIERTWVTDHYQIRVLISNDTAWYSFTLKEPTANGNTMTLYFGGEDCSYTIANAMYVAKSPTAVSLTPSPASVEVVGGTSLTDALQGVTVTVDYGSNGLTETIAATACSPTSSDYRPGETGDYTVTLTYGGKTTTVTVRVNAEHVHTYVNGVCSDCGGVCTHANMDDNVCADCGAVWTTATVDKTIENPVAFNTWYEFPAEVVLTRANSKIVVTGTQTTTLAQLYYTVLWECKQGFTGRFDNYGWTFGDASCGTNYSGTASIVDGETTYTLTGNEETDAANFWPRYREIANTENCAYSITFEWTVANALTVTVELSASDKVYTNVYTLPITNSSVTEWTFHLTAEQVTSFTVTDYSMYTWQD